MFFKKKPKNKKQAEQAEDRPVLCHHDVLRLYGEPERGYYEGFVYSDDSVYIRKIGNPHEKYFYYHEVNYKLDWEIVERCF